MVEVLVQAQRLVKLASIRVKFNSPDTGISQDSCSGLRVAMNEFGCGNVHGIKETHYRLIEGTDYRDVRLIIYRTEHQYLQLPAVPLPVRAESHHCMKEAESRKKNVPDSRPAIWFQMVSTMTLTPAAWQVEIMLANC